MKKLILPLLLLLMLFPQQAGALETNELLALAAMPLAVAAVAEIDEVPNEPLFELVRLMNAALVPPPQFIEVVRYAPVALVVESDRPQLVEVVRIRTESGVRGIELVRVIETEYRSYGLGDVSLLVEAPAPVVYFRDDYLVPAVVTTRLSSARRGHPHGGPPGQLKKELGLQTGAEVVHGTSRRADRVEKSRPVRRSEPAERVVSSSPPEGQRGKPARVKSGGPSERPPKADGAGRGGPPPHATQGSPPHAGGGKGNDKGGNPGKGKGSPGKGGGKG